MSYCSRKSIGLCFDARDGLGGAGCTWIYVAEMRIKAAVKERIRWCVRVCVRSAVVDGERKGLDVCRARWREERRGVWDGGYDNRQNFDAGIACVIRLKGLRGV